MDHRRDRPVGRARGPLIALATAAIALSPSVAPAGKRRVAVFPSGVDDAPWTRLLEKYVDGRGLVDYARWKAADADRRTLADFREGLGRAGTPASEEENLADLVNAYNAGIIGTILDHYPVDSIRSIPGAFSERSHRFGGETFSLDEIEHTAVALGGYRMHALMVCGARSCAPLDRKACSAADLSARADARMRAWMSRPDLYKFDRAHAIVQVPKYFEWYRADFEKAGIPAVLARYGPAADREWLAAGKFQTQILEYDWALNEQKAPRG